MLGWKSMNKHMREMARAILLLIAMIGYSPADETIDSTLAVPPLSITTSTEGMFAKGYSWYLTVNPAGEAELICPSPRIKKRWTISREELTRFRKALETENFFGLKDEYGESVVDGSTQTLTVVLGDKTHTVTIAFLMNWVHNDPRQLREPARAVRLFNLVREWFNEPQAVDLRRYDRMVLEAAEKDAQQSAAPLPRAPQAEPSEGAR